MAEENKKKKVKKILGIRGMNDILPEDAAVWELLEGTVESVLRSYGYQRIRTPIVEDTSLFARGLGAVTDIVEKEMYSFEDSMNGDQLTLRPECTAGVVRAAVEHNLTYNGPKRLWYAGPMFRHERPQRGRYRQFHQIGCEALGFPGPDIDAEMILLCHRLWQCLGLENVRLEINSIGNADERGRHRVDLIAYFEKHKGLLDDDAQRRLYTNPLRILDTKNPEMQDMVNAAPKLIDYLGEESLRHFEGLQKILTNSGIGFTINPRLVRGMDYYNRTVFEWISDELGSQGTICGGGRYDPLFEMFGGRNTPSCGFAMGVERIIELLKVQGGIEPQRQADIYVVHQGEKAGLQAVAVAEALRDCNLDVILYCGAANSGGSFKSQMKRADESGALFTVIIGEDEVASGKATVKEMRSGDTGGAQTSIPFEELPDHLLQRAIEACGVDGLCSVDGGLQEQ
ncbi:MAG: histidine--tRNA ligase [Oxalobacter sp.]|nr:histidine--tRNA ligase [Oxalobacter sp.]